MEERWRQACARASSPLHDGRGALRAEQAADGHGRARGQHGGGGGRPEVGSVVHVGAEHLVLLVVVVRVRVLLVRHRVAQRRLAGRRAQHHHAGLVELRWGRVLHWLVSVLLLLSVLLWLLASGARLLVHPGHARGRL